MRSLAFNALILAAWFEISLEGLRSFAVFTCASLTGTFSLGFIIILYKLEDFFAV